MDDIGAHIVGYMIEGRYGWKEFCPDHAGVPLFGNPEARVRTIDVYEASHSWREYQCVSCGRILWMHREKTTA